MHNSETLISYLFLQYKMHIALLEVIICFVIVLMVFGHDFPNEICHCFLADFYRFRDPHEADPGRPRRASGLGSYIISRREPGHFFSLRSEKRSHIHAHTNAITQHIHAHTPIPGDRRETGRSLNTPSMPVGRMLGGVGACPLIFKRVIGKPFPAVTA